MRLINITTLELEEFFGDAIPPYAILSHTWEEEEVTFQDWKDLDVARRKAGFRKIIKACEKTRNDIRELNYIWIDTNCIDKSSSAELSEAINSMFAWYRDAEVCYAYLADVSLDDSLRRGNDPPEDGVPDDDDNEQRLNGENANRISLGGDTSKLREFGSHIWRLEAYNPSPFLGIQRF